jgi:hypothetical protein
MNGIKIGDYLITYFDEKSVWIEYPSGEGMQVSNEKMIEVMNCLFDELF